MSRGEFFSRAAERWLDDLEGAAAIDAALEERVGAVPRWVLSQVDDGLRRALGI